MPQGFGGISGLGGCTGLACHGIQTHTNVCHGAENPAPAKFRHGGGCFILPPDAPQCVLSPSEPPLRVQPSKRKKRPKSRVRHVRNETPAGPLKPAAFPFRLRAPAGPPGPFCYGSVLLWLLGFRPKAPQTQTAGGFPTILPATAFIKFARARFIYLSRARALLKYLKGSLQT